MTYKITAETNGWIASRDSRFNGKTRVVLASGMTLREAQKSLLSMFNRDYDTWYSNWAHVRRKYSWETRSYPDGTRRYEYDSRIFKIEKEED